MCCWDKENKFEEKKVQINECDEICQETYSKHGFEVDFKFPGSGKCTIKEIKFGGTSKSQNIIS